MNRRCYHCHSRNTDPGSLFCRECLATNGPLSLRGPRPNRAQQLYPLLVVLGSATAAWVVWETIQWMRQ